MDKLDEKNPPKKIENQHPYEPPKIVTEKWELIGALCNGTTDLGRKATTNPPTPCNASRLKS